MSRLFFILSCSECPNMSYISAAGEKGRQEVCSQKDNWEIDNPISSPPDWCPLQKGLVELPEGTVLSLSDDRTITLYNKDSKKAGVIKFGEKNITFSGEIDKSADTLFSLVRYVVDRFFQEEK